MKLKITLLFFLFLAMASFSQNGINYKALIKDNIGNVVANQDIDVRFTLQYDAGVEFGIITQYEEVHTATTDANGIIVLVMGNGTVLSGVFPTDSWLYSSYLITEIDIERDGTFVDFGISEFEFVPKAIQARRADVARTATYVRSNSSGSSAINSNSMGVGTRTTNFGQTTVGFYNAVDNDLFFAVGNGTSDINRNNALVVMENGHVGIGVEDPQTDLHVSNNIRLSNINFQAASGVLTIGVNDVAPLVGLYQTSSEWGPVANNTVRLGSSAFRWSEIWSQNPLNTSSDRRLKKDIQPINYGLDAILNLKPVSYKWKDGKQDVKLGFIAQDVETVIPELVELNVTENKYDDSRKSTEDYYAMSYTELIPILVKGLQELKQENDKLKARIEALENN